jgi:hypothetical protein
VRIVPRRRRRWTLIPVLALAGVIAASGSALASPLAGHTGARPQERLASASQCADLMLWLTGSAPGAPGTSYSGYTSLLFTGSAKHPLNDVAFEISQGFPYAATGNWTLYPKLEALPTSAVTFSQAVPDPGSVNPNTPGTPIFAPNRGYHILMTASNITRLPSNLAGIANRMTWPSTQPEGQKITILERAYVALAGFTPSGTRSGTGWPVVTAYNVKTGAPVPCANWQPHRALIQRVSPFNTVGVGDFRTIPPLLKPMFPGLAGGNRFWPPKPNRRLLDFFRTPANGTGAPGGLVPPPDNCANYVMAKLIQDRIGVFRVPSLPTYQPHSPAPNALYTPTDVGAYVVTAIGSIRVPFRPGSPFNGQLANEAIKTDSRGGATFVVWPLTLSPAQRRVVFAEANRRGWNLLQGNRNGPLYGDQIIIRMNGTSSSYPYGPTPVPGVRSGAPCMNGPQSVLNSYPQTRSLKVVPPGTAWSSLGQEWAVVPSQMGPATPQGVQCTTAEFLGTRCLTRLKQHIAETGGSYYAPGT